MPLFLCLFFPLFLFAKISWYEEYVPAAEMAKSQEKMICIFFTGSDWSHWCSKMDKEIFQDEEFFKEIKDEFVFLKVDFPSHSRQSETLLEKNRLLKEEFRVKGFPTTILFDPKKGIVSKLGYLPVGGKRYAHHLQEMAKEYKQIQKEFKEKGDLKNLYTRAINLGAESLTQEIFEEGIKRDGSPFFLLEKYTQLVDKEENSLAAADLRKEIQGRDPKNLYGAHYRLANIDFQTLAERNEPVEKVIAPLLVYIEVFGKKDREHLWKIHMVLSQYLLSQGREKRALTHAREAYKVAPEVVRGEIKKSIQSLSKS